MDAKRPKEDDPASGAGLATGGPDRENTLLVKVLQLPQPPAEKLTLANVGEFLETECGRIARQQPAKGLEESILFLARGWRRSEEGGVVPSTWPGIPPFQEAVLTTAMTLLVCASSEDKVTALSALLEAPVPPKLMTELVSGAADDEGVPSQLLLSIGKQLKGRTLNDPRSQQFGKLLRVLRAHKRYAQAIVESPCLEEIWMPAFSPKFVWRNRKGEVIAKQRQGSVLQNNSLLGWALTPSALDGALMPPSKAHTSEAGSSEWADLRRATRQRVDALQRGTQLKLTAVQSHSFEFVDIMLRAGDVPRVKVLEWLGVILSSAEPRGKQGHIAPEGFNFWPQNGSHSIEILLSDQASPFDKSFKNMLLLQALHSRIYGFPTSGAAINAFTLLLHLCKPIKADAATGLSTSYLLREDIPDFLGGWQTEARFGEEDQVKAAKELAKADADFATPASDKKLFKTQIFWLASRGVGSLLLPVAKEAFQAWVHIASAFQDKDTSVSDTAWREYLLAESTLKEPAFLERLGHFIDLTFRFLQHVASGGKEALPPQEPSAAWNGLPSCILENILDLCDIYRDRQKKGSGMPTGLFVYLDPEPILTTLCIVMASDNHVRDPSLRGRAVKLMHRLCFAFPSWQEKLNQPPLMKNLIPCLINVFIAVEKAIMSYYDLSYRYKYELRIPVMDLFDLALQHEEHRRVLMTFTRGAGNDRFQKLLTQLINDSNSQTEEAIRTVKEWHEQQAKEKSEEASRAAPSTGPAGQHDEQVLNDDQTAEGEDVYRRSRMNYKEHAKKYFGLSARTWKQLWLLCKHCASVIVEGRTILEQLLHSSLDAQLHFLVGPEMKNIKASPAEYDELGFNPKELVRQIVEIYLFLVKVNQDEVVRIVGKDERYYSAQTFSKANSFVKKYGLLLGEPLNEFDSFVKDLASKVSEQRAAFNEADIPSEFLCEMMADIMSDPVMFPQSKKVVDRWVAERQIMGADRDPYANTPLKVEQLVPMTELKEKIHRFAKDKGIALEGGNMFA